jgi:hypothetical protein
VAPGARATLVVHDLDLGHGLDPGLDHDHGHGHGHGHTHDHSHDHGRALDPVPGPGLSGAPSPWRGGALIVCYWRRSFALEVDEGPVAPDGLGVRSCR